MRWIRERPKLGRRVRRKRRDSWAWGLHHNRDSAPTLPRQPLWSEAPKPPPGKGWRRHLPRSKPVGGCVRGLRGWGLSAAAVSFFWKSFYFSLPPSQPLPTSPPFPQSCITWSLDSCNPDPATNPLRWDGEGDLGVLGNGPNGEIEAAECAVSLWLR